MMKPTELLDLDPRLKVETISSTPFPQRLCWGAMHQCYYEEALVDSPAFTDTKMQEAWFGSNLVNHAVQYGHLSVLEHAQIAFNVIGFPHSGMQQLTRHRHLNFSVQSGRYTSKRFLDPSKDIEDIIYLRPAGIYTDRHGGGYVYSEDWRAQDLVFANHSRDHYRTNINHGKSEEHARGLLTFDFRQNFVMSGNLRAMLHLLHLRNKADAQLECQAAMVLLHEQLCLWAPEVLAWWDNKGSKGKLAP